MDYRFFVARRYLFSRKRITLISIITAISAIGVAVGVAALIVVLSVMNGFYDFVQDLLVSVDPHVRIEAATGDGLPRPDSVLALALSMPGVQAASPYVEGKALIAGEEGMDVSKVVIVRGIDSTGISPSMRSGFGSFRLARDGGLPGVIIGVDLARRLGFSPATSSLPASQFGLLSAQSLERRITQPFSGFFIPRFEVRGIYDFESVSDESRVYVSVAEAQRLFTMGSRFTGVELRLADLDRAADVKRRLQSHLSPGEYRVRTWYDLQESLYGVMKLEKWAATLILALIIIVAAFNIVASITMVVIEKRRDIGVLQAMGVSRQNVGRIFRLSGLLIGIGGTIAGLVMGLGLALVQKHFELVPLMGAESFLLDAYPVAIRPSDVVIIAVIAVGLCIAASLYPARRAASIEPAAAVQVTG